MLPKGVTSPQEGILRKAEWLAENAYIPPGMHRLLTVTGLMVGLWGGRKLMDIIIARNSEDGSDISSEHVPEILRPIHGIMKFNPYSDEASDRWRGIINSIAPVVIGGLGAYAARQHYFNGGFGAEKHHALSHALRAQADKKMTLEVADGMMSFHQSNAIAKLSSGSLAIGSTAGTHLTGALFPLNNGSVATSFQLGNLSKNNFPLPTFLKTPLNRLMGNNSGGSQHQFRVIRDWVKWAESNIAHNSHIDWKNEGEIARRAHDMLQIFPNISAGERKAFEHEMRILLNKLSDFATSLESKGETIASIEQKLHDTAKASFSGEALEKIYQRCGIDITKAEIGVNGPFTAIARLFGSAENEEKTLSALHQHWRDDLKMDIAHLSTKPNNNHIGNWVSAASTASALGLAGYAAQHEWNIKNARNFQRESSALSKDSVDSNSEHNVQNKPSAPTHNFADWLNSKPLDTMEWLSRILVIPPSMHRFMSAAYLSAGLMVGMQVADTLAGRKLGLIRAKSGAENMLTKENAWAILKPLHGMLSYVPGKMAAQDRWRQVAHTLIPVGFGAAGTYMGSNAFFKTREEKLKNPEYLEEFTDNISLNQSKPFGALTAITSIFNTGSGIHILPFFNYSANLHDRYLMANGQQVAFPLIGKLWSGNPSTLPWGVNKTLTYTINYLTHNPSGHPDKLPELAYAIIAKLYPTLSEAQIVEKEKLLIDRIYVARNPFLMEDTIAPSRKNELHSALTEILTKEGLEKTLLSVGLNPMEANLSSNGVSGAIANILGQREYVGRMEKTYQQKVAKRLGDSEKTAQNDNKKMGAHVQREEERTRIPSVLAI